MTFIKRMSIFLITNFLVMAAISVIVSLLGFRMDGLWGLLILCAMFGMGGSFISLMLSKSMAKWSYKVQVIKPGVAHPKAAFFLLAAINNMAEQQGITPPEVGIYNSPDANAFATGASQNSALIAFSTGIIDKLNEDELAAVAGHELSHITNGDMVTMTLLMGIVNTFVMFFARIIAYAINSSLRDNRGGGLGYFGYIMVVSLLQNALMLLAYIPISSYSRFREFRADAGAARLTGAIPMIEALKKISMAYHPEKRSDSYALAKINNRRKVSLFSTHPSMEARIERLQALI